MGEKGYFHSTLVEKKNCNRPQRSEQGCLGGGGKGGHPRNRSPLFARWLSFLISPPLFPIPVLIPTRFLVFSFPLVFVDACFSLHLCVSVLFLNMCILHMYFLCIVCAYRSVSVCLPRHVWVGVKVRGRLSGVSSPLPSCRSWGLNLGPQAWQQTLLLAESSCWPLHLCFLKLSSFSPSGFFLSSLSQPTSAKVEKTELLVALSVLFLIVSYSMFLIFKANGVFSVSLQIRTPCCLPTEGIQ